MISTGRSRREISTVRYGTVGGEGDEATVRDEGSSRNAGVRTGFNTKIMR